jgi:hypothetical protein
MGSALVQVKGMKSHLRFVGMRLELRLIVRCNASQVQITLPHQESSALSCLRLPHHLQVHTGHELTFEQQLLS